MKTRTILRQTMAVGALAAFWGCEDDGTGLDTPFLDDEVVEQDVALLAADAVAEDLMALRDLVPREIRGVPGEGRLERVRSRTVEFYDAQGTLQDAYDPAATAAIHTVLEVEGEGERMGMSMSLTRTRDLWVRGLEGEEVRRTTDGTGTESRTRAHVSDEFGERTYSLSGELQVEDVVHGVPRSEFPWPLSGTLTRTVQVDKVGGPGGDRSFTREVVITFNGEPVVTMTVDGEAYELDLTRRDRRRVQRRVRPS